MTGAPPKVFISYSHDTVEHQERVLGFADRLRADGIDAEVDQYNAAPPEGWPLWCERQIEAADVVLMVCTETYYRRVSGDEERGKGLGVVWEARIIRQRLYDAGANSNKFVPVLFSDASPEQIPTPIKGWTRYVVDTEDGYEELYRRLTGQPRLVRPPIGTIRVLPTRTRQWPEGTMEAASSSPAPGPTPAPDKDFAVFHDIDVPWCPELVALPAGEFMMGSPEDEEGRFSNEGPQHRVTIGYRFAVGQYAVTFAEYDRFCEITGRRKPPDLGCGRDRQPVINVSWQDAKSFAKRLSQDTRQPYRLPSEAEWEYACRAGTTKLYAFGDDLRSNANYDLEKGKTSAVGSYSPNAWHLYDMHGNVWEWVEDVWHPNYRAAPDHGKAWTCGGESELRVVRGGSFYSAARYLRSATRQPLCYIKKMKHTGFRIARDL